MLKIDHASKKFGAHTLFQNLSLTLEKESIIGLAGPSGCGKTTLLRCIQQLENLDSGTIHLQGKSGFMFQDFQLFPHMTVLKNLIYAPSLHKLNNLENQAYTLLNHLGIGEKALSYPAQLSGGQKQRVALARSLMMQPDLLLCDEPTSGLDKATTEEVIILLKQVKTMGISLLIASHDLVFLEKIADKIVEFRNINPGE
jgi:polar amino acid transport system ATP-binding protein